MFIQLSRHWWWLALRGIAMILFSLIALAWRGDSLSSFTLLFGGFALADGLSAIFVALTHVTGENRRWILSHGLLSVVLAILSFIWTDATASILLYLVAAWALITGILELVGAWEVRRNVSNDWLLILSGMASIIFGLLVIGLRFLETDGVSITEMVGPFAMIFGLLTLAMSLNLRSIAKYMRTVRGPLSIPFAYGTTATRRVRSNKENRNE
jgi:uncharacterized membrane protein HdeD (DUF308 family)